jgi:hypothetical protein
MLGLQLPPAVSAITNERRHAAVVLSQLQSLR